MTIQQIQRECEAEGSHWFERDTMRFFKTRFNHRPREVTDYNDDGSVANRWTIFITSERGPYGGRKWSIRVHPHGTGKVHTLDMLRGADLGGTFGFQAFGSREASVRALYLVTPADCAHA